MGDSDNNNNSSSPGYLKRFGRWILSPFVSSSQHEVDKYRLGKNPGEETDNDRMTFMNIHVDNFVLGSAWGLISGYTSEAFFLPVPDKFKALKFLGYFNKFRYLKVLQKHDLIYPTFVAIRAARRAILAGIVFDQAEYRTAKNLGFGHGTTSNLIGLTVLSIFFRVSTDIRHAVIASSTILGGYVIGSNAVKLVKSFSGEKTSNKYSDSNKKDE